MTAKAKRRIRRIHLSTAVLLLIAAGFLMLKNSERRIVELPSSRAVRFGYIGRGWPLQFGRMEVVSGDDWDVADDVLKVPINVEKREWTGLVNPLAKDPVLSQNFFIDAAVSLVILSIVAIISEYFIRRREGKVHDD